MDRERRWGTLCVWWSRPTSLMASSQFLFTSTLLNSFGILKANLRTSTCLALLLGSSLSGIDLISVPIVVTSIKFPLPHFVPDKPLSASSQTTQRIYKGRHTSHRKLSWVHARESPRCFPMKAGRGCINQTSLSCSTKSLTCCPASHVNPRLPVGQARKVLMHGLSSTCPFPIPNKTLNDLLVLVLGGYPTGDSWLLRLIRGSRR